ncbi:hypothetical protein ACH5RR_040578 [Cinchona calisaya]|uniref:SNF2 N-terminal domain-containing protein n=1 Tax=Cinchona calisaya TaxID=153742 RepID=A0ABD2XTV1_9GENT
MENGLLIDGSLESNLVNYESATFAKTKEGGSRQEANKDGKGRFSVFDHQLDRFLFLCNNIIGETCIEDLMSQLSDDGRGCIISHVPGTGKTCVTVVFILSLMKMYPIHQPLIIAPSRILLAWKDEFQKWDIDIPFHNLNSELTAYEEELAEFILQK